MKHAFMSSGQALIWKGQLFNLDRLIDNEWQLIEEKTKKASHLFVEDFMDKYAKGDIRFLDDGPVFIPDSINQPDGRKIAAHLDLYPAEDQEKMKCRRLFLQAYLKNYGDKRSQKTLDEGIKTLWKPTWGNPPHPGNAAKWLKRYIESGSDIRALGPRNDRKGNKTPRYPDEVTEICNKSIGRIYLSMNRGSIDACQAEAIKLVATENLSRPDDEQLPLPSKPYIKALIARIPEYDKHARRYGKTAAMHRFRKDENSIVVERPLQRVEIDHTKLDIVIVDHLTGMPLGRPWLTLVLDVHSRAILGFSLSFDPPSHMTVARALKMALKPKVKLNERWPSIKGAWPMHGCMEDLIVDNGLEFHGDSLEAACFMLGINISFCPRKKSWWKGHIERVIGTLNRAVTDGMSGRTFSSIKDRGDYNSVSAAAIPLNTMEEMIAKWIVDVYHQTCHSTLGVKPIDAWENGISPEDIPLVAGTAELDAVMGIIANRTLSHRGIELNLLRYNSDELSQVRYQFGNIRDITVKWDPEDLGFIHVLPPDGKTIRVPVVSAYADYASGLTFYQHTQCKAYSRRFLEGRDDVLALAEAKVAIRELAEKGMQETAKKTRAQNSRLMNKAKVQEKQPPSTTLVDSPEMLVVNTPVPTVRKKFKPKLSDRKNPKEQFHD